MAGQITLTCCFKRCFKTSCQTGREPGKGLIQICTTTFPDPVQNSLQINLLISFKGQNPQPHSIDAQCNATCNIVLLVVMKSMYFACTETEKIVKIKITLLGTDFIKLFFIMSLSFLSCTLIHSCILTSKAFAKYAYPCTFILNH